MNQKLKEFSLQNKALEFTQMDEGYDFLNAEDSWFQFKNQNGSEDVLLRVGSDEITMHFGDWNYTFPNTEEGVDQCIEECKSLFDDRSYVWKATFAGQNVISLIRDEPGRFYEMAKKGFKANFNGKLIEFDPSQIEQEFLFWDPAMMNPLETPYLM